MRGWSTRDRGARDRYTGRYTERENDPYLGQIRAQQTLETLVTNLRIEFGNSLSDQVYERLRAALYEWAKVMMDSAEDKTAFENMHKRLAKGIQSRVVRAYSAGQNRRRIPSYRWADTDKRMRRYSNKQMLAALKSPELIDYDYKGIYFPNTDFLDNAAKQWYRLNFGAEPASTRPVNQPTMRFGSAKSTKTSINFDGFKPSKPFMVPSLRTEGRVKGIWSRTFLSKSPLFTSKSGDLIFSQAASKRVKSGYTGAFDPKLAKRSALYLMPNLPNSSLGFESRLSKGIVGARFLDEGLVYLNNQYGKELSKLMEQWRRKANAAGKAVAEAKSTKKRSIKVLDTVGSSKFAISEGISYESIEAFIKTGGDPEDLTPSQLRGFGLTKVQIRKWKDLGFALSALPGIR
jgi:hypothetical protein